MNQIPIAPPLPPVLVPAVNIGPKIVEQLLDACRFGDSDKVGFVRMT